MAGLVVGAVAGELATLRVPTRAHELRCNGGAR